ncbi:MAG: hypothetical protein U9N78_08135 [Actinomycetota bacterium]|nr:hypothetical protein [Actinomycetota bacterium]
MKRIAVGLFALALVLTACQSAAEVISEQVIEEAVGGGDVKIDTDSGEVSLETDDGSITIGGGELPDGFPVPLPDGYKVTGVFTSDRSSTVSLAYPEGDFAAIEAFFDDWTSDQSGEWSKSNSSISGDEGSMDNANWIEASGDASSMINMSSFCLMEIDTIDGENCVSVDINVTTE